MGCVANVAGALMASLWFRLIVYGAEFKSWLPLIKAFCFKCNTAFAKGDRL